MLLLKREIPKTGKQAVTNRCFITFMAVDDAGYPTPVPVYTAKTEEDKQLEKVAIQAKDFAKKLDSEFEEKLGWK